ncbi:MAG: hypothetical protein ACKPKO_05350, partial [Candidatus Fonsibacter sp.]
MLPRPDASVENGRDYQSAKDVLEKFGYDSNTVIHIPECGEQCIVHPHDNKDSLPFKHDVVPAKSRARNWAYTDSVDIKEWLIDTGCGNDILSKRDVVSVKDYIKKAKRPVVFHTANGSTTTNSVAWIHIRELDEDITPYGMSNAPPVLTVG